MHVVPDISLIALRKVHGKHNRTLVQLIFWHRAWKSCLAACFYAMLMGYAVPRWRSNQRGGWSWFFLQYSTRILTCRWQRAIEWTLWLLLRMAIRCFKIHPLWFPRQRGRLGGYSMVQKRGAYRMRYISSDILFYSSVSIARLHLTHQI